MTASIIFRLGRDPLPDHVPGDQREAPRCGRCPATWEPDDLVCAACGAEQSAPLRKGAQIYLDRMVAASVS